MLGINRDPQQNSCRPAVDVLFRSVAQTYGANVLAVVLTGMGADGTRGSAEVREAGGEVIVQDEASSVVWGHARECSCRQPGGSNIRSPKKLTWLDCCTTSGF